jgi:hypothetical protein
MADQPYDYSRSPTQSEPGQWPERTQPARPAPPYPSSNRPQLTELHRPFRTGIALGFGFMVASLIVAVVVVAIMMVLGIGLAGLSSRVSL